jgi:hypothetical protein
MPTSRGGSTPAAARDCARGTDLLDHYWHVQRQEQAFRSTWRWARHAHRFATWALWLSGGSILLAVIALLIR